MRFRIKDHGLFLGVLVLFVLLLGFFSSAQSDLWWDSSVYLGMGKYLYSGGSQGLYEDARPVVWPLMLGLFWKLGLDAVFFGRVLLGLFGIGSVVITYLIGVRLFSKRVAVLGSLFLAMNSTFFLFSSVLHSEIPSLFFLLLGLYLFIDKRYLLSGFSLGIAVMTRFFEMVVVLGIVGYVLFMIFKKHISRNETLLMGVGFGVPVLTFLLFSFIRYGSFLYPFLLQAWMTQHTGWIFHQPIGFYVVGLLTATVLVVFSLVGIASKRKNYLLLVVFFFSFVPYLFSAHKEMRIIIQALPFLFLLTAEGIFIVSERLKLGKVFVGVVLVVFLVQALPQLEGNEYDAGHEAFRTYLAGVAENEVVWITNPGFVAGSNHRAELMYYPLYSSERIDELRGLVSDASHLLLSSCDILPCSESDVLCEAKHGEFMLALKESHRLAYENSVGGCEQLIYAR